MNNGMPILIQILIWVVAGLICAALLYQLCKGVPTDRKVGLTCIAIAEVAGVMYIFQLGWLFNGILAVSVFFTIVIAMAIGGKPVVEGVIHNTMGTSQSPNRD